MLNDEMLNAQRGFAVCVALLLLSACADAATSPTDERADLSLLTPAVAAQLDSRGRFREQEVESGYVNPRTRAHADSLARRFIVQESSMMRDAWEQERGAPIDATRLSRCAPILYSSSAYEIAAMAQDRRWRQSLGGQYHLLFCGPDGRPAIRVQVPVEPAFPASGFSGDLANIQARGVAIEHEATALISPEEVVRLAAGRTGRRVASVPEYVNERFLFGFPRWIVRLESPIRVLGAESAQVDTIDVVGVGFSTTERGYPFIPTALRPYGFATLEARLDTLVGLAGDPIDVYAARVGNPRWLEPFIRLNP